MKTWQWIVVVVVAIAIIIVGLAVFGVPAKAPTVTTDNTQATTTPETKVASIPDLIVVSAPTIDASVTSPITITGSARGSWYFEASFPIVLTDWDGKIIAQGHAEAQGDWMTSDFVPFTATLTYTTPTAGDPAKNRGTLILKKDNPSGDPARDQALEIPVVFK